MHFKIMSTRSIVVRFLASYYDLRTLLMNLATGKIVVRSPSIVLRWKGASELDLELMRHRTTIWFIVVRFVRDLEFFYKSQTDLWGKGSELYREKLTSGAGWLSRRWETIKTHSRLWISCNEFFFIISYLCFSHE